MRTSVATPLAASIPSPAELLNPHMQSAFDATPTGIVIVDHLHRVAHSNRAANSLFRWTRPMHGESADFLFAQGSRPQASAGRVSATLHLPLDEGIQLKDELLRRDDGSDFSAQIDLSPVQTTEGTWYVATVTDLTEQKRLESTVQASRQQLHDFFEVAPQAVITFEADGAIVGANANAARIFGYDPAGLSGLSFAQLSSPLPTVGATREQSARKKDGTSFPIEVTGALLPLDEGSRFVALITDLTGRKQLEQSLQEATSKVLTLMGGHPGKPAPPSTDPLKNLAGRELLTGFLTSVSTAPAGWNAIVFTVRHHKILSERLGKGVADRLLDFASQYIRQSLSGESDNLFHWGGATMVATVKRDAISDARQEASEISGRRLEHLMERGGGGTAMVLISLASSTFSLEGLSEQQMIQRIEAAALQGGR